VSTGFCAAKSPLTTWCVCFAQGRTRDDLDKRFFDRGRSRKGLAAGSFFEGTRKRLRGAIRVKNNLPGVLARASLVWFHQGFRTSYIRNG
jgi:hypothetical protein